MGGDFVPFPDNLDEWFESTFSRALSGEKFDFDCKDLTLYRHLSKMFEVLTARLMADVPSRKYTWYDGLARLSARSRKAQQIEFNGEMWVGDIGDVRSQWKEDFKVRVTDKRVTQQGIWVTLWLGPDRAEARWLEIFPPRE